MSNETDEEYLGTPLLEGATTLLLIGGNELGREILVEAHRLGLETILVSDHQYAPASHLSHRRHVVHYDDDGAIRAIFRREQPDLIVQDSAAISPQTLQSAIEDGSPAIFPQLSITELLNNQAKTLETASLSKAGVVPFSLAKTISELKESCLKLGLPSLIQENSLNAETPERWAKSPADLQRLVDDLTRSNLQSQFLVRKFMPFDMQVTEYAVANNVGEGREAVSFSQPIATLGTSLTPHVTWQPLWTIDEHTRMSTTPFSGYGSALHRREEGPSRDYLWESEWNGRYIPADTTKEIETKLKDYSTRVLIQLQGNLAKPLRGVFRLDFLVRLRARESGNKPEVYLTTISPNMNETALLTLATQQPTIPACIVRTALGITVPTITSTASGAAHMIQAREESGWAPAFFNLNTACEASGTFIQLFGKHRFSASEPVGVAFAMDGDIVNARENALACAHKVEEGIDYGG